MRPEDLYVPSDFDALRMENELLAFENEYLRARVAEERALRSAARADDHAAQQLVPAGSRVVPRDTYEELRKAKSDLVWLVKRMNSSPVGLALRRWQGWKILVGRYLGADDQTP